MDFVIHLAGYYDFVLNDRIEYETVNVNGTKNILELSKLLHIKLFIFASSLAACTFSSGYTTVIDEQSPADADFAYARSKRASEEMLKEYSDFYSCTVLRFAAVYSDWCEYPPLYMFLETWLTNKWNSKIIAGKGESSVTYIHINDLIGLFFKIIGKYKELPPYSVYVASPGGTVSHNDLYQSSTEYFFGHSKKSCKIPKHFASLGIHARLLLGRLTGNIPFERPWMIKYIDKKLIVENKTTTSDLSWYPTRRYDILRRLLVMIDKLKNNPVEWKMKNNAALAKITHRPNIFAYEIMLDMREILTDKMVNYLTAGENRNRFPNYQKMDKDLLKWFIILVYQLIAVTVRSKSRQLIKNYVGVITFYRYLEGYEIEEIIDFTQTLVNIIISALSEKIESKKNKTELFHFINIVTQLTTDEMEDHYEFLKSQGISVPPKTEAPQQYANIDFIKSMLVKLEDAFYESFELQLNDGFKWQQQY